MLTFTRTLRFRMALTFGLLMVVLQGSLALILPKVQESMALQQSDALLAEKAGAIVEYAEAALREGREISRDDLQRILERNYENARLYAQVRTGEKRIPGATKGLTEVSFPLITPEDSGWGSDRRGASFFLTTDLPGVPGSDLFGGSSSVRIVTKRLTRPNGAPAYVQVAAPISEIDLTRSLLRRGLLFAGLGSTLVAAIVGWAIGAFVTDKADRVRTAVGKISAERLGERVDLPAGDDEIGRMAGEVNLMLERVAQAFLAHERFIAHASHELKTPVATLLAEAQALRIGQAEDSEYRHFARSVEDEMRRLSKLVESFLLLARFGHGRRFTAESRLPINEIVIDCVQHAALLAQQAGVSIHPTLFDPGSSADGVPIDGIVRCDAELLRVAFDNLIRNAVQISAKGDRVDVRVECTATRAIITVRDHGPGIPAEYLDRIFDKFAQVPRDEQNRRGTGLGLTIAKGVIDLHDGRIEVRNAVDGGAEFAVDLPLADGGPSRVVSLPSPTESSPPPAPSGSPSGPAAQPAMS